MSDSRKTAYDYTNINEQPYGVPPLSREAWAKMTPAQRQARTEWYRNNATAEYLKRGSKFNRKDRL